MVIIGVSLLVTVLTPKGSYWIVNNFPFMLTIILKIIDVLSFTRYDPKLHKLESYRMASFKMTTDPGLDVLKIFITMVSEVFDHIP